jgi:hypothetical protein
MMRSKLIYYGLLVSTAVVTAFIASAQAILNKPMPIVTLIDEGPFARPIYGVTTSISLLDLDDLIVTVRHGDILRYMPGNRSEMLFSLRQDIKSNDFRYTFADGLGGGIIQWDRQGNPQFFFVYASFERPDRSLEYRLYRIPFEGRVTLNKQAAVLVISGLPYARKHSGGGMVISGPYLYLTTSDTGTEDGVLDNVQCPPSALVRQNWQIEEGRVSGSS